ncbi:TPA: hypothetical protein NKV63_001702 [Vibrio parahaemolyticus]|nr:hypothetical protein [Vibrio parahaemolyticus]
MQIPPTFYPIELELLQAFNVKQLELTSDFVSHIDDHVETQTKKIFYQTHAEDEGEAVEVEVPHIGGISADEYDFKSIFSEILPMYQRQSMLVTNWGIFENELKKYYSYLASKLGKSPSIPKKKNVDGKLESALQHLVRVFKELGLLTEQSPLFDAAFTALDQEVRCVRNDWVHNGGVPKNTKNLEEIQGISLNGNQMDISADYLENATNHMWTLSSEISSSAIDLVKSNQWINN